MNGLRERLYPNGFRPMRFGVPLFVEANLNPHYWPFRGIVLSIVVHASLLTGLIVIPLVVPEDERPNLADAIILDADDLKDVLYLPLLGTAPPPKPHADQHKVQQPSPAPEGLSYPGPQPILSKFPVPTNHTQTILQPALKNPVTLENVRLPNVVRLPPPAAERKLAVPDAAVPDLRPPPMLAPRDINLPSPSQPLAAPRVENRLYVPEALTPVARPNAPLPVAPLDATLSGPTGLLAAPRVESRLAVPDQAMTPTARASAPVPLALDPTLSGPSRPLAAPLVESRFKLPEPTTPIARPALPVQVGETTIGLSGPSRPLPAPRAESRLSVPDAVSPQAVQPARTTAAVPLDVPLTGPARPLTAPRAESKLNVPDASTPQGQPGRRTPIAPMDVPLAAGPARPLAAPLAESKLRVADTPAAPVARPGTAPTAPKLDVPLTGPARPLAAPIAESRLKVPEGPVNPVARPPTVPVPLDSSFTNGPPIVALSPTPARRDQTVVVPLGEARGQFAISPEPNLTFPGTEPGVRGGSSSTSNSVAGVVNSGSSSTSSANARGGNNNTSSATSAGRDAFAGITILGGDTGPAITTVTSAPSSTGAAKTPPPPLQTSYDISILASGASGGGLPDFGVFTNEQVHTVYLDMRDTVLDELVLWTVAFGVRQPEATSADERVATVSSRQVIELPFPKEKAKPSIPADFVRRFSGRLVIAYAVVSTEGKIEQLSIKESPDPALNELVLSTLRKWTFRPARRNGEVIPAKMLLGIPVRTY